MVGHCVELSFQVGLALLHSSGESKELLFYGRVILFGTIGRLCLFTSLSTLLLSFQENEIEPLIRDIGHNDKIEAIKLKLFECTVALFRNGVAILVRKPYRTCCISWWSIAEHP